MLEKMVQSIRKNAIFGTFFRFFWIFGHFKKSKKTSIWTEKKRASALFSVFSKK